MRLACSIGHLRRISRIPRTIYFSLCGRALLTSPPSSGDSEIKKKQKSISYESGKV
jgi:hypothetical protein